MTIEYLRYFIYTYKLGSLYKAAKELYISPQGVSRGIKKLEDDLGHELFSRTQSGLRPTPFSEAIYPRAKKLVGDFDELYDLALNYTVGNEAIDFGLLGHNAISDAFRVAAEEYQSLNMNCPMVLRVFSASDYERLYEKLDNGELDMAWIFHTDEEEKYRYYSFHRSPVKCAMSKDSPLAAREEVRWEDLKDQRFIMAGKSELYPKLIHEQCEKFGFHPDEAFFSVDSVHMARLIAQGKAMCLLFFEYIDTLRSVNPDIVFKSIEPRLYITSSIITRRDNDDPEIVKAARFLQTQLMDN